MVPLPHQHQPSRTGPLVAYKTVSRRTVNRQAHDCVTIHVVRSGSMIFTSGDLQQPMSVGDAILIAPLTPTSYVPEGEAGVTTLLIDMDYLIEQLFWQHVTLIPDRDAARDLAARLYPEPVQVLRLGEREIEHLGPLLDELVSRTGEDQSPPGYFRAHALLFTVLAALAPLIRYAPVTVPPLTSRQRAVRLPIPRWREFIPIRREIARTAALMQNDIARRWSLTELAAHACLSTSRYGDLFKESFGVTPLTYLSILRVREMARLIRETDLLITTITERVGWCYHSGHATIAFRRYMGVTPIEYRHYGPPAASREGPGIGVARAVRTA